MYQISNATIKARCTKNVKSANKHKKTPSQGDIMMPVKDYHGTLEPYTDMYGEPYRIIVTHSYMDYIFGIVSNNIPNTKQVSEALMTSVFPEAQFAYDVEMALRAEIEGKTAAILCIENAHRQISLFKQYSQEMKNALLNANLFDYKGDRNALTTYFYYRDNGPNRHGGLDVHWNNAGIRAGNKNTIDHLLDNRRHYYMSKIELPNNFKEWKEKKGV